MFRPFLTLLRQRAKTLGSAILALGLAGSSMSLTSCTTEEGLVVGALTGAVVGGVVGHQSERSHRNYRRGSNNYNNNNHYNGGRYYSEPRYRRSSYPTGYSNRGYYSGGGNECYDYY